MGKLVLISPLRRAVETACLAFAGTRVPMRICRHAREGWWEELNNTPGTPEEMYKFLKTLPRGSQMQGIEDALTARADDPSDEDESFERMRQVLLKCVEPIVIVVCHWGTINGLCGESAENCEVVECDLMRSGRMRVLQNHAAPGGPKTFE